MLRYRNRLILVGLIGVLLLTGFVVGRLTGPETTAKAFNEQAKPQLSASPAAAGDAQTFYLSDFKTGYNDGYTNGLNSEATAAVMTTTRAGYNDGFKQGFASGYQARISDVPAAPVSRLSSAPARERVVYRSVDRERPVLTRRDKRNSTLKTILTIAAPAALGAGVGGAVGGKKGAGVGALLGGGGGALYHLIKNK